MRQYVIITIAVLTAITLAWIFLADNTITIGH